MGIATMKCWMIFSNVLVMLSGLASLGLGACWNLRVKLIVDFFGRTNDSLSVVLMVLGGFVALVAFLGFYGATKQIVWMLIIFAMIMILMLLVEIVCIVFVFLKISWSGKSIKNKMSPKKFQLYVSAFICVIGILEIIALALACLLVKTIRKIRKQQEA